MALKIKSKHLIFIFVLSLLWEHEVMAAILVIQNDETAATLVYRETNAVWVELFSYVNTSFCYNKCMVKGV